MNAGMREIENAIKKKSFKRKKKIETEINCILGKLYIKYQGHFSFISK